MSFRALFFRFFDQQESANNVVLKSTAAEEESHATAVAKVQCDNIFFRLIPST